MRTVKRSRPLLLALVLLVGAAGCDGSGEESDAASPTPSRTPTLSNVSPSPVPPPTESPPVPSPTISPTSRAIATATFTPSGTTTASATPSPTPTATPSPATPPILEELASTGVGRYLGIEPVESRQNGAWTEFFYDPSAEEAICLRGTPYQVDVRWGSPESVLLYLEGGGACWNFLTCWQTPLAKAEAGSALESGILRADDPRNPFRDWSVVYVPYCDGSVFAGVRTVDYQGNRTYHHGLQNLSAAVTRMRAEFPDASSIVVAGSSAGGFGTFTAYGVVRVAYPEAKILVFNDSGPGFQNPADVEAARERAENWGFGPFVPESCERCQEQFSYLADWALDRDPSLRSALFNYLQDSVLRFFLAIDAGGFESLLRSISGEIHDRHPDRFKRFLKAGSAHTVLLSPAFYELEIEGITVAEWTADFLVDGPKWVDLVDP